MAIKPKLPNENTASGHAMRQSAIDQADRDHGHLPNVIGFGFGPKTSAGAKTDEEAIIVYVDRKFTTTEEIVLAGSRGIPASIDVDGRQVSTDVVEAQFQFDDAAAQTTSRFRRQNPVCPGISVGNLGAAGDAGTIGAIVARTTSGRIAALSCHHVLVHASADDRINQPGRLDDPGFVDLGRDQPGPSNLGILRGPRILGFDGDAALAVVNDRAVRREIEGLGVAVDATGDPKRGDIVAKSGRTTGVTYGRIVSILERFIDVAGTTASIDVFSIEPLDSEKPISGKGDSGAAWMLCEMIGSRPVVTSTMVGLHTGASLGLGLAYASFAKRVFKSLDIRPATADDIREHEETLELARSMGDAIPAPVPAPAPVPLPVAGTQKVIGRHGARLRPTPAVRPFDDRLLPTGTLLHVRRTSDHADGRWAEVDLEGDNLVDGFVHSSLLAAVDATAIVAAAATGSAIDRVTPAIVAQLFDNLPFVRANIVRHLPPVLSGLRLFGLIDADMVLMALATIKAETAGFVPINEFRSTFNSVVADFDRYETGTPVGAKLGNTRPGDGARFRGRGFVQLTGRDNYQTIGDQLGLPLVDQPESANDPVNAGRILAAFLHRREALIRADLRIGGDVGLKAARRRINGGSHGFAQFKGVMEKGRSLVV